MQRISTTVIGLVGEGARACAATRVVPLDAADKV
jgi:hypothetical protein